MTPPWRHALVFWLIGCGSSPESPLLDDLGTEQPNLLVILTDDQGVDLVEGWGADGGGIDTPSVTRLVDAGVRFTHTYASPTCTPTRAALLTGRHPRRSGLGSVINSGEDIELGLEVVTIAEAMPAAYASSAVGKWHVSSGVSPSGLDHPNLQGFDWFAGTLGNLGSAVTPGEDDDAVGYYQWERVENGTAAPDTRYVTTVTIDDAIDRLETMPEPWLLYVALHAPHSPLDPPPDALNPRGVDGDSGKPARVRAIVEAMDHEVGRLLDAVQPLQDHTYVAFLSDNGTSDFAYEPPREGKNTPLETGIRVPMVWVGPGVPAGETVTTPAHVVDLLPTLVELAGGELPGVVLDGRSLVPLWASGTWEPRTIYTEKFLPNGFGPLNHDWRIVRDGRFKYVQVTTVEGGVKEQLHDLEGQGDEVDLLLEPLSGEAQAAYDMLSAEAELRVEAMLADEAWGE